MKKQIILILSLLIILSSCIKKDNIVKTDYLSAKKIKSIKKGVTTKKDIIRKFGDPESDLSLAKFDSFFYKDENLKTMLIKFNKEGKVIDVLISN